MDNRHSLKATLLRDADKFFDETYIRHADDAQLAYDGQWDAYKMKNLSTAAPQIYTTGMSTNLTINSFSYYDYPGQKVPLMVTVPSIDTFKLAFNLNESMGDFNYILEDKTLGNFHNLSDGDTIKVYMSKLVEKSRFVVHIVSSTTGIGSNKTDNVLLYVSQGNLVLRTPDDYAKGTLKMFDATGRLIKTEEIFSNNNEIKVDNISGKLIIAVYESEGKVFKRRVML